MRAHLKTGLFLAGVMTFATAAFAQTPSVLPAKMGVATSKAASSKTALIDINTASRDDLKALKGVGDKRADDIIKGRPYKGKDELVQKKIIPQGVYNGIKDKIIAKQS